MGPIRRAAVTGLLAAWLAPLPAAAESQADSLRVDRWSEDAPAPRYEQGQAWRHGSRLGVPWFQPIRRPARDDD